MSAVSQFCALMHTTFDRLDILINNACQTIRRPAAYYDHLQDKEAKGSRALGERARVLLQLNETVVPAVAQGDGHSSSEAGSTQSQADRAFPSAASSSPATPTSTSTATLASSSSAAQAARCVHPDDFEHEVQRVRSSATTTVGLEADEGTVESGASNAGRAVADGQGTSGPMLVAPDGTKPVLPKHVYDVNGQQLDLRKNNSWLLKLEEVAPIEVAEVLAINSLAPYVLVSKLHPLMTAEASTALDKFVINVSAMEGKFYRKKTPHHPHTNMAKAALNMMTRTSAADFAKSRVFMNAVDTGWINDENPIEKAAKIASDMDFQTPIDEIDAAARVLDPVMVGINENKLHFGCFFKDYHITEW
eukprot:m.206764 g.206764  ORF g.206764 m.206764 type:complete len:362 (-) comp18506_c1_seq2:1459-2544(-)